MLGVFQQTEALKISRNHVVSITGCDSGLGYSLAKYAFDLGFTVIATFLDTASVGARNLEEYCGNYLIPIHLDLTNDQSIKDVGMAVKACIQQNRVLYAHINNAAVMIFGEYDWLPDQLIEQQIRINFTGTVKLTQSLISLLRTHKGRVITVSSHCARTTLPGLALYSSTKAALRAWSDGLRLELAKYGVAVVQFVPGSFVHESHILSRLKSDQRAIEENLSDEKRKFYSDYICRFFEYLSMVPAPSSIGQVTDKHLYEKFHAALMDARPSPVYKNEPWRYKLYHLLFDWVPSWQLRDALIFKFAQLPSWESPSQSSNRKSK